MQKNNKFEKFKLKKEKKKKKKPPQNCKSPTQRQRFIKTIRGMIKQKKKPQKLKQIS